MPPREDNRAVVRRLFEAVNSCDDASLDELVAPDCEIIGPAGAGRGPAIYRQVFGLLRAAFPDVHIIIEEMLEAEGTASLCGPGPAAPTEVCLWASLARKSR